MEQMVLIIAIVFGSITVTTLGCVWMGISYVSRRDGLIKGATQREITTLQQKVNDAQQEMAALQTEVKRLIEIAKGSGE